MIIVTAIYVANTAINYAEYGEAVNMPIAVNIALVAGITFISATATEFIPLELLYLSNKKKQQDIESDLNDSE